MKIVNYSALFTYQFVCQFEFPSEGGQGGLPEGRGQRRGTERGVAEGRDQRRGADKGASEDEGTRGGGTMLDSRLSSTRLKHIDIHLCVRRVPASPFLLIFVRKWRKSRAF